MTKKDYELMAAVMKSHSVLHQKATKAIMNSLIEHLKKDNPKFDEIDEYLQQFGFKHKDTKLCLEKNWGDAMFEKE